MRSSTRLHTHESAAPRTTPEKTVTQQHRMQAHITTATARRPAAMRPEAARHDDSAAQSDHEPATPSAPPRRRLLLVLHGKRMDDDSIRDAVTQLRQEGHSVRAWMSNARQEEYAVINPLGVRACGPARSPSG